MPGFCLTLMFRFSLCFPNNYPVKTDWHVYQNIGFVYQNIGFVWHVYQNIGLVKNFLTFASH